MQELAAPRFVPLDVETSGLLTPGRLKFPLLLEIACVVLDETFRPIPAILDDGAQVIGQEFLCMPHEPIDPQNSDDGAIELHSKNGLLDDLRNTQKIKYTYPEIEQMLGRYLDHHGIPEGCRSAVLVGNNPEFDREFVRRYLPRLESRFHYRSLNVSSLREVAAIVARVNSRRLKQAHEPQRPHRASADVEACVRELHTYARAMGAGASAIHEALKGIAA